MPDEQVVTPAATTPATAAEPAKVEKPAAPAASADATKNAPEPKADSGKTEKSLLDQAGEKGKEEAEKKEGTEAEKAKSVAPDKYEFKAPEGMTLNQAAVDSFSPVAKEIGLTQEQAQKVVDVYSGLVKAQADSQEQAFKDYQESQKQESLKALGANAPEQLSFVAKVRDTFFSPETRELINASGLGNNINFIRDCIKLGKQISEEKLVEGKNQGEGVTADQLFPSMAKK